MTVRAPLRFGVLAACSAAIVAGGAALYLAGEAEVPSGEPRPLVAQPSRARPSLDCAFHDFMRRGTVVSYYFDVDASESEPPRFYERAIVASDGTRTNFRGDERPAWRYERNSDGEQTITAPDGATRIVLYGLKLDAPGVLPVEAGIRSNEYRNLGGECRQSGLGGSRE